MDVPKSVHVSDWPTPGKMDTTVLSQMNWAREVVTEGLAARAEAKIKVRQPLAGVKVNAIHPVNTQILDIVKEELNVKQVEFEEVETRTIPVLDTKVTPELKAEGLMRDVVRHVQSARKQAGLAVEDRIVLTLTTENADLAAAINVHAEVIKAETLATELVIEGESDSVPVKVDGAALYIGVRRERRPRP